MVGFLAKTFSAATAILWIVPADASTVYYYTYKNRWNHTKSITSPLPPETMIPLGYFHVMTVTDGRTIAMSPDMSVIAKTIAKHKQVDEWLVNAVILSKNNMPVSITNQNATLMITNTVETLGRRYTDNLPNEPYPKLLAITTKRIQGDLGRVLDRYGPFFFRNHIESTGYKIINKFKFEAPQLKTTGQYDRDLVNAAWQLNKYMKNINATLDGIIKELVDSRPSR
jgi:hypothetical protein